MRLQLMPHHEMSASPEVRIDIHGPTMTSAIPITHAVEELRATALREAIVLAMSAIALTSSAPATINSVVFSAREDGEASR